MSPEQSQQQASQSHEASSAENNPSPSLTLAVSGAIQAVRYKLSRSDGHLPEFRPQPAALEIGEVPSIWDQEEAEELAQLDDDIQRTTQDVLRSRKEADEPLTEGDYHATLRQSTRKALAEYFDSDDPELLTDAYSKITAFRRDVNSEGGIKIRRKPVLNPSTIKSVPLPASASIHATPENQPNEKKRHHLHDHAKTSVEKDSDAIADPFQFALTYLAGATRKEQDADKPFDTMDQLSLIGAFARRGGKLEDAMAAYKRLKEFSLIDDQGIVDKDLVVSVLSAFKNNS